MSWADCFAAAPDEVTIEEIREALTARRTASDAEVDDDEETVGEPAEPSPARVVADADVLAADVCVGGDARTALEPLYGHSWTTLVASDRLLDDAEAVIGSVGSQRLAADWRECIDEWREPVDQPAGDHPALASAYRGGAMHILSFDEELTASGTGLALHERFPVSVRQPDAFALLFDPENLYENEGVGDGPYPGPDRDPRA